MYFSFQIHASQSLILSFISFSLLESCQRSHCRLTGNITVNVAFCLDPLYVVKSCCSGSKTKCFIFEGVHQSAFGTVEQFNPSSLSQSTQCLSLLPTPSTHRFRSLAPSSPSQSRISSSLPGLLLLSQSHPQSLRHCHSPLRPATLCT